MKRNQVKVRYTGLFEMNVEGNDLEQRRKKAESMLKASAVKPYCESVQLVPEDDVSRWESYCDSHILYLRPLDMLGNVVEYLKVTEEKSSDACYVLHGTVFLNDYLQRIQILDELLAGFGYSSYQEYAAENDADPMLLAMYIVESFTEDGQLLLTTAETQQFLLHYIGKSFEFGMDSASVQLNGVGVK